MEDYCLLVSMAMERGLGSWSRQIGFNVCVRLNDCCTTKPLRMQGLISALWLRRHDILLCLWISYIHYVCGSLLTGSEKHILFYPIFLMYHTTYLVIPHSTVLHFSVLYNTCLLDQTCRYARTKLMASF